VRFDPFNKACIRRAVGIYREDPAVWKKLTVQAMKQDFSWKQSAILYSELFASML
jgi:glycogen synthase